MLGRTVASATRPLGLRPLLAFQAPLLGLLATGGLSLALAQGPMVPAPQGALVSLGYEIRSGLDGAQGLAPAAPTSLGWLNPGADIDASVSTDGEDIAAPVADIAEFRSKDAFLAVDALFGGAAAANAAAAGGAAVLATALAQDTL